MKIHRQNLISKASTYQSITNNHINTHQPNVEAQTLHF